MSPPTIRRRDVLVGIGAAAGIVACGGKELIDRRRGVAVVGIGAHSLERVIPAIGESARCRLAGLVSGSAEKLVETGDRFGVPPAARLHYDDLERIADNPDIDIVYVVVPNALHAEFAIRAAQAGKHVLVEKPMAVSVEQCKAMIAASAAANRQLAVAYRLHFDPLHREVQRLARERVYGMAKLTRNSIGFPLTRDDWRLSGDLSGGLLLEQGVYAVNAACNLAGIEPIEVTAYGAKSDHARFSEVDESVFWSMQFPDGSVAQCAASYTVRMNSMRVDAVSGHFELEPAYSSKGLRGTRTKGEFEFEEGNQIALMLDAFAESIDDGTAPTRGSAAEGLRDVRVLAAVEQALRSGEVVTLA